MIIRSILFCLLFACSAIAAPTLNFSDITSGPKLGNTDGVGSGAIVTVWGNNLGSSQGLSKVYVGNVEVTAIYYWKDADGDLPGGPADLKTYHKMQEIAFSVPSSAVDGANTIKVIVGGLTSNTLPFTVRTGNIYFIKSTGNDTTGLGSWTSPWATLGGVLSGSPRLIPGDIVYSVGIGSSSNVEVGAVADLTGTLDNPYSVIVYPNTTGYMKATNAAFHNLAKGASPNKTSSNYVNFSKFTVSTSYQGFSTFGYSRVVGNNVTGIVPSGFSGWIGGSCADMAQPLQCGGQKILGNEIHGYGSVDGTDVSHHLYYITNRSGKTAPAYEIGWNYHHDNTAYQGIHIYDTSSSSPWSGTFKIHHNVIKNQSGNAINLNSPSFGDYEVYNNLTVLDAGYNPIGGSYINPGSALRIDIGSSNSTCRVYNNTFYGYNAVNNLTSGITDYRNNLMVDNRGIAYFNYTPTTHSNNLFYSTGSTTQPSWATSEAGHITGDPVFTNQSMYDFTLQSSSPAVDAGYDVSSVVSYDFVGTARSVPVSIGAFEYFDGAAGGVSLLAPTLHRLPGGAPYGIVQ